MSNLAEHKTKKRKPAAAAVEEPSSKRSKTEKVKDKSKKDKKDKSKEQAKGKGKEVLDSQFRVVEASLLLSIPPVFANNLRAGAEEMLDSMLMRYESPCTRCMYPEIMRQLVLREDTYLRCKALCWDTMTFASLIQKRRSRPTVRSRTALSASGLLYGVHTSVRS